MTNKEQIQARIHQSLQSPLAKAGKDIFANSLIKKFVDDLTEEQAAAILSIDSLIDQYTDGTQSPPFDIGWTLWMLISITAADHNGAIPSLEDVKETAHGFNKNSYPTETSSFWAELVSSLEMAGASEPSIEAFKAIVPKSYIMPVNKLHNSIPSKIAAAGNDGSDVTVVPANKKRDAITTHVVLTLDAPNIQIAGRVKPTAFDMAIQNGIISLLASGNEVITPSMAYRAMTGMTETQWISPQQEAAVTRSIEKQRSTKIFIDATEEARAYSKEPNDVEEFTFDGFLIAADRATVTINGAKHTAYIFGHDRHGKVQTPILYRYAQISQQIQTVPAEALRLPMNNTEKNIVLRDYLLREIGAIRNPKSNRRPEITFKGIYDHLNIDQDGKTAKVEMKRARDATEKILGHWESTGYIKSYSTYKKGQTIAGIKVTP